PHDNTNILRFALAVIAMGLILLFGLLIGCLIVLARDAGLISLVSPIRWVSLLVDRFTVFLLWHHRYIPFVQTLLHTMRSRSIYASAEERVARCKPSSCGETRDGKKLTCPRHVVL